MWYFTWILGLLLALCVWHHQCALAGAIPRTWIVR